MCVNVYTLKLLQKSHSTGASFTTCLCRETSPWLFQNHREIQKISRVRTQRLMVVLCVGFYLFLYVGAQCELKLGLVFFYMAVF